MAAQIAVFPLCFSEIGLKYKYSKKSIEKDGFKELQKHSYR